MIRRYAMVTQFSVVMLTFVRDLMALLNLGALLLRHLRVTA